MDLMHETLASMAVAPTGLHFGEALKLDSNLPALPVRLRSFGSFSGSGCHSRSF